MKEKTVRTHHPASGSMHRYYGNLETNLYAAEVLCSNTNQNSPFKCTLGCSCPFRKRNTEHGISYRCLLVEIRNILGDNPNKQMDTSEHARPDNQFNPPV